MEDNMGDNPIQYTSTDYNSILNDINSDSELASKPTWWKRIWAGVGDVLHLIMNAVANQAFIGSSFTRQAVTDLCALIDYQLSSQSTANGSILFHLDPATVTFPVSFTASELIAKSQGSITASSKQFESRSGKTVSAVNETFTADAGTDRLTVARVYTTGEKVRLTTTDPLALATDYYAIYYDATHIYLANTQTEAYQGTHINITDAGVGTHTIHLYSFTATVYQQESLAAAVSVGTSDGVTEWQEFELPDLWVLLDTLVVTINSATWTDDLTPESILTDLHFKFIAMQDGASKIMFGNGTYGAIPGNFDVSVSYATGGGASSNIYGSNKINVYTGGSSYINGCANYGDITGGADEEQISKAKVLAPFLLKARSRDITINDTKYFSEKYTGVMRAGVNPNYYGPITQQVIIVPSGGGTASPTLLTNLAAYLQALTILDYTYTVCVSATYVPVSITAAVKIIAGWAWATVQSYVVLALRLMFSEVTKEIIDTYDSYGIADTVAYINTKWSTSFTANDYNSIMRMLDALTPADFGQDFQESDVLGFIDSYVDGVDYLTISAPAFPITTDVDEIVQDNINPALITQIT
jgi:hypothetical protein